MRTSTRKDAIFQSALNQTLKTDPGMLPRRQALEGSPADTPDRRRNGADRIAGGQAVRGEPGSGRHHWGSGRDPESSASRVFVLDRRGAQLIPAHPARARKPLKMGRPVVLRLNSFTIRFRSRVRGETLEVELEIDPGAKTTGVGTVRCSA